MDTCHNCGAELTEETPYCEPCTDAQIEADLKQWEQHENDMAEIYAKVEHLKREYEIILDLINDDKLVRNRYEYHQLLKPLIKARDAYIKAVVNDLGAEHLPEYLQPLYEANKVFYTKSYWSPVVWNSRSSDMWSENDKGWSRWNVKTGS